MLTTLSIYDGLSKIARPELILDETIVPSKCPVNVNSLYTKEYNWLFGYERKLCHFLRPWMSKFRYQLIGDKGVLCEALSNAFSHGHKKNPDTPITIRVYKGQTGLLIRIKDQGEGFNIKAVLERYKTGQTYYHTAGNGFINMANVPFEIFYTDNGSAFNLLYLFNKTDNKPPEL